MKTKTKIEEFKIDLIDTILMIFLKIKFIKMIPKMRKTMKNLKINLITNSLTMLMLKENFVNGYKNLIQSNLLNTFSESNYN